MLGEGGEIKSKVITLPKSGPHKLYVVSAVFISSKCYVGAHVG